MSSGDGGYSAYDDDFVTNCTSRVTHNYKFGALGPLTQNNFDTHQAICVWIMKFMGLLSMIASYFIMRDMVIRYYNRERIRLTSKVVFELSVGDFFGSFFSAFMGTWMVPEESGIYMAAGTVASCTAQGFFKTLFYGIAITMNAVLAITYYKLVKNEREDGTRTTRSTRLILGLPPLIPLLFSICPLFNSGYNYTDIGYCGIGAFPLGCSVVFEVFHQCTRGTEAVEMKYAELGYILLINIIIVTSVVLMISHAKSKDMKMNTTATNSIPAHNPYDDYATNNNDNHNNNTTTKVVWQGIWYVCGFMIAWVPWYVWQWIRITDEGYLVLGKYESTALLYILSITNPSQGFLNSLVFFRPSYLKYRYRDEEEFRLASICRVLNIPVPRWWKSLFKWKEEKEEFGGVGTTNQEERIKNAKRDDPQDIGNNT